MSRRLAVLGGGAVGRAVLRRAPKLGFDVVAFADTGGALLLFNEISDCYTLPEQIAVHKEKRPDVQLGNLPLSIIPKSTTIVDCTACDTPEHMEFLLKRMSRIDGGAGNRDILPSRVVLANKHPLSGSQAQFNAFDARRRYLRYEATVGSCMPFISTIRQLLTGGETITCMAGCLSGSLDRIAHLLGCGYSLGRAVEILQEAGKMDACPDEDLSGRDVARKALILARTAGWEFEGLEDVAFKPFDMPEHFTSPRYVTAENASFDPETEDEDFSASRYVAVMKPEKIEAETREAHMFNFISMQDNALHIWTDNVYKNRPLTLHGTGTGPEAAAAALLAECA